MGTRSIAETLRDVLHRVRRTQPPPAVPEPTPPRAAPSPEEVRHLLAQHWARAGLLSGMGEPWRPICCALGLAAASALELDDVDRLLREQIGREMSPELANIWRQALAELRAGAIGQGPAIEDPADWSREAVIERIREVMDAAQRAADVLVQKRSQPPPPAT